MYMALKHSHMLFATLSILLLVVRFGLSFTSSTLLQSKFLKIVPHVIDTVVVAQCRLVDDDLVTISILFTLVD